MLAELKFCMGAVSKKDLIPGMKHFCIEKGTVRAYNGALGLCAPIDFDIDCKPHAQQLIKAISNCSEEHVVTMSMTDAGRLRVVNGNYKVFVDCIQEETPHVLPAGNWVPIDGKELRAAFATLQPFIGADASRPDVNGVLLHAQSAYATNNVIVAQYWLGTPIPLTLNVPSEAVREVLRVKDDATHIQVTESSITFHFPDGRWIRSGLWQHTYLDQIVNLLERVQGNPVPFPENFFEGLESVKPFLNKMGEVYFQNSEITTDLADGHGARYALQGFPHTGCFVLEILQKLDGVAKFIDFSNYPNPCVWHGDKVRGLIVGRHLPHAP
jgi:hypothetical protein